MTKFQRLTNFLHKQSSAQDRDDGWRWEFSVKSYYGKLLNMEDVVFHILRFGFLKHQEMCVLSLVYQYEGVILTVENLRKRKVTYVSWRVMCNRAGEDVDHLLVHYSVTSRLG